MLLKNVRYFVVDVYSRLFIKLLYIIHTKLFLTILTQYLTLYLILNNIVWYEIENPFYAYTFKKSLL